MAITRAVSLTRRVAAPNSSSISPTIPGSAAHGAAQHLANAMFRAIENRRPLIRDANTGVTCIIDAQGRILHSLRNSDGSPFLEGVLFGTVDVPQAPVVTFYSRHGDWPAHAATLATALYLLWRLLARCRAAPPAQ